MLKEAGERLRQVRTQKGLKQEEFAKILSTRQQNLSRYESGGLEMPDDLKVALRNELGIDLNWLLTGKGSMFVEKGETNLVPNGTGRVIMQRGARLIEIEGDPNDTVVFVNLISQPLSAGRGIDLEEDVHAFKRIPVIQSLLYPYTPDEVRAAVVRGDSMTGVQLFDGDIVLFVPEEKTGDGIFVITVHGEVFVKRLAFDPFHRQVTIISENERYQPTVIKEDEADGFTIEGKVRAWFHRHPY